MTFDRAPYFNQLRRVVIKIGSGVLTGAYGLNNAVIDRLSHQINDLLDSGIEVLLVSSGAMAAGQKKVGLDRRPDEIPRRQAVAAVGQAGLMLTYETAFARYDRKVAQILLTNDDLSVSRRRYLNARNTLHTLLSWQVLPIINENDTVVVEEIKFGDNDNLSALIALMMNADVLINLTDIDSLYTGDPRSDPAAQKIEVVDDINREIETVASGLPGALGTGGMLSKIKAARKVTAAGIPMVIANGGAEDILQKLFSAASCGTFFVPARARLSNRKCWIGFTVKPKGTITIDDGAVAAIMEKGKSLLPGGIVKAEGEFGIGAPVMIKDRRGRGLATGLVNYSASEIRKIMGCQSHQIKEVLHYKPYDEVIHRDNMAVLGECE
ncbi:MAG: glutamate 5-kinase [Thermodesulfobacteriota bacterium]